VRKRSPHLIIADPGLRGASGHHPAAALTLARSGGFSSVLVCAHREADPAIEKWLQAPGLKFERHFSRYLYERESLDRPMSAALADIRALADEYADLVSRTESAGKAGSAAAGAGVLMLHHTADWLQVAAIGHMLQRQPESSRPFPQTPQHLIFLTHAPGVAHSGQVHSPRRLLNWRIALASLKGRRDVALFTSCEDLRQIYSQFCGLGEAIGVHPVFHFDAPDWAVSAASRRPRLKKGQAQQLLLYVVDPAKHRNPLS
jgi:hypothetical protein